MDGAPPPSIQNKRRPMVIAVPPPPRSSQNGHPRHNSAHSSTTSLSSEHHRVPGIIRYPSDSNNGVDYASSRNSTSLMNGCGSMQGPAIDRLREENARLRLRAEEITTDSNRRVEMHVAEIRMLKEETKRLRGAIGEMEGERNKARQLAHEWHKFARYSSDLVKQEVRSYDAKLKEAHGRLRRLREENVELRQICLYLDEQRHATTASRRLSARSEESDDQGCGSSDHSIEGGGEGYCLQKENSLRRICMGGEEEERTGGGGGEEKGEGLANDRLLSYIHSLESRIQHLELTTTGGGGGGVGGERREDTWRSSISPETDDLTVMEREWDGRETRERREGGENMGGSTSTMTSSGTTFCSSSMDGDDHNLMMMMTSPSSGGSSVFVDGSEGGYGHLEVRTLPPIEEELKDDLSASTERGEDGGEKRISQEVALSALLPPCMEPISSSSPRSVSEAVDALRMREQRAAAAAASAQQLQHTENLYARWSPSEPKYHLSAL
ncbi:picc-1 [Pristionchus pacificus]|uniref:Picc-1 n=1 Tax=Pristionchus pacificus TaxID=54126 RepID=A0A2A6BRQ4_PRIPA|nr:picc-1 [Pristionchus pacificus]|eukprot:PDM68548.1 picc-1 [Pristionchus pacificus]